MSAPTRTCGQCGTRSNHEGWCLVCGGSYAGSHDFHAKTFALSVADRISATRERIMGTQGAEAKLAEIRAFVQGQTRHNCGLARQLREMLE